jgi:hypothetical protein
MSARYVKTFLAALLAVSGASSLQAQDYGPYKFDIKTRLGLYAGDMQTTHYDNKLFGYGIQMRRELFGPTNSISVEVTFEHVPGRHHDITDYKKNDQLNTREETPNFLNGVLALHPYWSFDNRKEKGSGFSVLVSYYSKMPTGFGYILDHFMENTEWFVGLRLDRFKVYSEFKWTLRDQDAKQNNGQRYPYIPNWPDPYPHPGTGNPPMPPAYDGGNGAFHEEASNLTPGAFAGIKYTLNDTIAFELGARFFGMKHWDYTNGAYYGEAEGPYGNYLKGYDTDKRPIYGGYGGRMNVGSTFGYGIEFALVCKL